MKPYVVSLAVGLLVGAIYSLLSVKSPAPPAIALLGLLGMLLGEQAVPAARRIITGRPAASAAAVAKPQPGRSPGDLAKTVSSPEKA